MYKSYYNQGYKRCYESYDVNPEDQHAFVTDLSFKVKKSGWGNETCGILDILSDKFDPNGNEILKFPLEHDGKFDLPFLSKFMCTYITLNSRASQDDAMLYNCIISRLSSDGLVKVSNRSEDYH